MFGTLWVYTTVFGHAMASSVHITGDVGTDYLIWVGVFAVVVVPLTCMELREQVGVQVVLSLARFAMVLFMVGTTAGAMAGKEGVEQFGHQSGARGAPLVDLSGFYKMVPIATYANIYHHSIPGLSMPVADKSRLGFVFGATFAFGMFAYSLIGGTVAWYFGDGVDEAGANINWGV
jgi:amino acid permease